ncbi:efflux RND transporter periplasmic adaptor subunit [Clostridium sp. YIM B02555]|uniref:efflux RND transporter periplasmic adaptor subunit n=1 Tax=Clostridium sp. YIM B02555 TaxID=2911968 RepID=UPI001EEE4D3E|nr:efflux RND transporter periplasmic adaptor subunit [Clostridium sp. YIM B02555]
MKKVILGALCLICTSTLLISCNNNSDIANVTVTKVKMSNSISDNTYTANVESGDKISIIPSAAGKIQTINVDVGQSVKKGDTLFTIDNTELTYKVNQAQANYDAANIAYAKTAGGSAKQAQNDAATALEKAKNELKDAQNQYQNNTAIASAQTAYNDAKANYDRTNTLYQASAATKVDLDTAKSKLDTASAALDIAKATAETRLNNAKTSFAAASQNASITSSVLNPDNIAAAKAQVDSSKAALDIANHQLENATVTAPIDGKISAKNISVGELAPTQTPSLVLENEAALNVLIKVTETNINSIAVGMAAKISVPSTGISYDGAITTISPSADQKTGMFDVKINITNPDDKIKIGMVTNISLVDSKSDNSLLVPNESVINEDGSSYIYVINGDKLTKRVVTLGQAKNQYIEVKDGVSADDQVVVEGSSNMKDNGKFNIVKSN